ncbi:hypothetical protein EDD28_2597 [Salana multivorans]|uniref:Uncharacterized protein n=1 Tax=Salana multivorans TaxID=120377 RepID=A0A3N2D092_9MICO|nr:hypothetical protein [Salana multivorans]MBN8882013.1 hypothetical protein [Salana multivorans]ROR93189.1 hypothetical protein EDD28_2597 [Salana multivorans]
MRERRARSGLAVIAAVSLAASASLVTALVLRPPPPPELTGPGGGGSAPVDAIEFWDERAVTLEPDWERPVEVRSPGAGMVTADSCFAGRALLGGESLLSLGGIEVVMIDTAVPLWRDLVPGDVGPDVDAVEELVVRRGEPAQVSGALSEATIAAFDAAVGGGPIVRDGVRVLAADRAMWVPPGEPTVDDCVVTVGQTVEPGEVVATLTPTLRSLEVVVDGGVDGVDGGDDDPSARSLVVDGIEVHLPDGGVLSGDDLDALASAPSLRAQSLESGPPVGTTRRRDPIAAYVVPPAAITVAIDGTTCVHSDGEVRVVEVVGSELGRTYVTSPVELARVETGRTEAPSCG